MDYRRFLYSSIAFAGALSVTTTLRLHYGSLCHFPVDYGHQPPNMEEIKFVSASELQAINARILGPEKYGKGCPPGCGCRTTPSDCPRHYDATDVNKSASAVLDSKSSIYFAHELELQHIKAIRQCKSSLGLETGGYCLSNRTIHGTLDLPDGRVVPVANANVRASEQVGMTITNMFKNENVTSVSDFGASVGKYGYYLKTHIPDLVYYGYDGTGDIESFTHGFIKYADLTLPLNFPVTEWVLSLEVGEHIPSKFEGMFVRNLHRHNCKGIILSWGVLGQRGENHINLHSNEYVARIFDELGYDRDFDVEKELRNPENNHKFFVKSAMVYRRRRQTCHGFG